eukprot:CAMPEP_0196808784 /NCGR_PEP_ID=MMETSP1362-20130617/8774_1 /TAXON_ID=163516 /ORGANISM="Leptocylindrus danicus, Strain CCMP1856" /LENGTH=652 /DNA_ID=CAMNT_0042183249 /DNA_START=348 /DNA_END=2306 /DNA_ORIENTATION=+
MASFASESSDYAFRAVSLTANVLEGGNNEDGNQNSVSNDQQHRVGNNLLSSSSSSSYDTTTSSDDADTIPTALDDNSSNVSEVAGGDNSKNIDVSCLVNCCIPRFFFFRRNIDDNSPIYVNYNVCLMILLSIGYGIAESLWSNTVLAVYLKDVSHGGNKFVGFMEMTNGLAAIIAALPIGYLADKYSRSRIIRYGGVVLLIAAVLDSGLVSWIGCSEDVILDDLPQRKLWIALFVISECLWGIGGGIVDGPAMALYADSVPAGNRSYFYVVLHRWHMISTAIGPLISVILFAIFDDTWDLCVLKNIIFIGLGVEVCSAFFMLFFRDDKALNEESSYGSGSYSESSSISSIRRIRRSLLVDEGIHEIGLNLTVASATSSKGSNASALERAKKMKSRKKLIPYFLFLQSCIAGFGLGMTEVFFPLFFKDKLDLTPVQVQTIFTIEPLLVAASFGPARLISRRIGRIQSMALCKSIGIVLLFVLALLGQEFFVQKDNVIIVLYLLQEMFISATDPLEESVLMYYSPRSQRATWMSLESVVEFGWAGSAVFGGVISDKYGYEAAILTSAIIQSVGVFIFVFFLLPIVPWNEENLWSDDNDADEEESSLSSSLSEAVENIVADASIIPINTEELETPLLDAGHRTNESIKAFDTHRL